MADDQITIKATEFAKWHYYMEQLAPLADKIAALSSGPHDKLWRDELYQFLYSQISVGYLIMMTDPKYPEFMSYYNHINNQGFPNPDDVTSQAMIEDGGIYRISGFRGTARIVSLQLANDVGSIARMIDKPEQLVGGSKGVLNLDSLSFGEDGSFELQLSPERPDGYEGDWFKLNPGATMVIIRQRHYDWINEVNGRFAIERLDVPAAKPRLSGAEIENALNKIVKYIESYGTVSFVGATTKHLRTSTIRNKFAIKDYSHYGALATQVFIEGMFELAPDEALVVETEIPKECSYWGFNLADDFWRSIDWVNHQSSLNGHTARVDDDGKVRMVVSAIDPGVPNWLDTVGRGEGFFYGRWADASDHPTPTAIRVKAADVRRYLPTNTPTITLEDRDASIRLRRRAVQLRRRW